MIPPAFEYERATSLEQALGLVARPGIDAKVIAGGQSLLPLMKLRLARPARLIDIGRLDALRGVRDEAGGELVIGALTTYAELLEDPRIGAFGALADALPRIGDVQVRNRGTIGGSVAHADPAADLAPVLLALDATIVARSAARGQHAMAIDEFFHGAFTTALAEDELLTEVRLPASARSAASAYQALAQQASGYPIAGVAASFSTGREARIAVTGVGEQPYRAMGVERALEGGAAVDEAVASITEGVAVGGDVHADPEYRAAMARVMAKRAIELARARMAAAGAGDAPASRRT